MPLYRKPDVYIEEISVFPPSVTEVETAIPAFIGYTASATSKNARDLILVPTRICSMLEFETYFGVQYEDTIAVTVGSDKLGNITLTSLSEPVLNYILYYSVKMFFDNGGGSCYIVSVGTYQPSRKIGLKGDAGSDPSFGLQDGLDKISLVDEPSLIVIPEAVKLSPADYTALVQAVLAQCQNLGDRFAIFDLYDGDKQDVNLSVNRGYFGRKYLQYGAAYFPFIRTSMNFYLTPDESNISVKYSGGSGTLGQLKSSNTAVYNFVIAELKCHFVVLPPSGAIAGAYAATDYKRGVWKAPANLCLANVIEPVVKLDNSHQDLLNIDADTGKSINALRAFTGKGTLVWGARTLSGNDNEGCYVPVRRLLIMIEESVKKSSQWAVFEPNTANTWVEICGMIENFLSRKWQEGALAGTTAKEAFFVRCGLGVTMTNQDILDGLLNIEIGLATLRPAEFIILKFSQKMMG